MIADRYSRYLDGFAVAKKSHIPKKLIKWMKTHQKILNLPISIFRSDNGTEFCNKRLTKDLNSADNLHH